MANKGQVSDPLMKRRGSFSFLPPDMSELRVILLGNSWSERSSVGNFILGTNAFTTEEEPDRCLYLGRKLKDKTVTLINTPNLLQPDVSLENLTSLSDPGPHVFLLVLQPEDFTKEDNQRLQSILETFSERSWTHSVLLITTPEEEILSPLEETFPSLRDFIRKCRKTLLWNENLQQDLLTSLRNMMKENNGEHLTPSDSRGTHSDSLSGPQSLKSEGASANIYQAPVDGNTHGLRIMLFGKSDEKKTALGNIITGKEEFKVSSKRSLFKQHVSASVKQEGKPLTVVKTPDLFNMSLEAVRKEMKKCVELCSPGPNVLLLLVKNSEFTEEDRKTLLFILSLFGQDVFKHSMVVLTHKDEARHSSVDQLIQDCQQKAHSFTLDKKKASKQEIQSLMQKMENIASTNRGQFLVLDREADVAAVRREPEPPLNLVLFGRRGAGKTSAVKAILGPGRLGPAANSSQCVRSQGEVCGRWVSVVELPALHGRPQEEVMEECLSCVSLCDPEGVHAFILVLPVAPLTDEDKSELQTIQKTFSSRVNDFIMILFTVDSESSSLNVLQENKELQELCQSCPGEHFVLNINGGQELSRFIYNVETMIGDRNEAQSYTMKMLCNAHIGKISELEEKINLLQSEIKNPKTKIPDSCENEEENQNTDCLRIVLLGKTGCGKSSAGNTILGREEFKAGLGTNSVTKSCQKEVCEVDNRKVAVVDTPGLFDDSFSSEELQEELVKCVSLLAPGPHVFLLVVRIGRFTPEEKQTLELIREGFGKNSLHFTIILLTGGDELEKKNMSDEEYIEKHCCDSFKSLIANCGGRYHVFNNDKKDPSQVRQLIAKIDTMVKKNGGDCFTNEMLQEAEASIKKEMEKLLKEKEEGMKREMEELRKKHEEEIQKLNMRMEKQRAELEEERKLMEEQLKEKEERIRKEREMRKREQEEREEEDRRKKSQEEVQRQEWKQMLEALEKKIKSESEQKENIDQKLVETREEMRKEREIWEEERKDWWEKREKENKEIRQKEQTRLLKLQEEFEQEREKYEKKRKEEDEKKQQEEEKKRQELEENFKKDLENIQKKHEEEARKQAEEFNEFKMKKEKEFADLTDKHTEDVKGLNEKYSKAQQELKENEDKEKSLKNQMEELLKKHKLELTDMTAVILNQIKANRKEMEKLRKKHNEDMNKLLSDQQRALDKKMKEEIDRLKQVQQKEMAALKKEPQTEEKERREKEMSTKHEEERKARRTKVENQQRQTWKKEMDKLQKQQDEEIKSLKQEVLDKSKLKGKIDALQKEHDKQIKYLLQKISDGDGDVKELEELLKKHEAEMKELKEKLFPSWCRIS